MREKYESLSLVVLKDLAKARGLKGISTMKKGELKDRILRKKNSTKRQNLRQRQYIPRGQLPHKNE